MVGTCKGTCMVSTCIWGHVWYMYGKYRTCISTCMVSTDMYGTCMVSTCMWGYVWYMYGKYMYMGICMVHVW